jgi:hypothetical protein
MMYLTKFFNLRTVFLTGLLIGAIHSIIFSDDVKFKPLSIGGLQEFGMINKGIVGGGEIIPLHNEWIDHFGAFMYQEAAIKERFLLQAGLGGIFQFPKQEKPERGIFGSQAKMFYLGPSTAKGTFLLGNVETPFLKIGLGSFPFKYNSHTPNLGEYLFRSAPYPTFIMTGGFATIDNATAYLQGLHMEASAANFKFDVLLATETSLPPYYDLSLAGLAQYTLADGLFEIGAGFKLKGVISIDEDKTTPKTKSNGYFNYNNQDYVLYENYYKFPASFWEFKSRESQALADTLRSHALTDPANSAAYEAAAQQQDALVAQYEANKKKWDDQLAVVTQISLSRDSLEAFIDTSQSPSEKQAAIANLNALPAYKYFTTAGIILMGRFAFDIKKLFNADIFGENDLKLFGEIALLGVKNYPVFYENMKDRMPYTIGFNLPGFKFIDLISFQYEIFNSPYSNSFMALGQETAIPQFPVGDKEEYSEQTYNDVINKDNTSWSMLIRKELFPGFTFSAQAGRDHLRTVSTSIYFGARLEPKEVMYRSDYWYWMAQFAWSM